jgi:DsbC/DsbD-like thiol-disulfide interchange protein/cytochrome c biogenesis protein CcdA
MLLLRTFLFSLCLLFGMVSVRAQMPLNVPARIEFETSTPAPGRKVTIAFVMQPKSGWHGYWQNPGDAGYGMSLKWTLPKGVTAGQLRYPVPDTLMISGLMNYVFKDEHVLLVDLTIDPAIAKGMPLSVKVHGEWLGCTDTICVPQQDDLALNLITGDGAITKAQRTRFDGYRAAIPVPLDRLGQYRIAGKTIEIAIPYPASAPLKQPYFFPLSDGLFVYKTVQSVRRVGDWLVIKAAVTATSKLPIEGLLRYGDGQGILLKALPGIVPVGGELVRGDSVKTPDAKNDASSTSLWSLLSFAILGGLILNLMPCVFPILGLKALALAKAGGNEKSARRDALAYSFGVILSCLSLGALLLVLRASGQEVGWAFQLQEPSFVLFLLLLMVAITANLAGLFEIGSLSAGDSLTRKEGLTGSFWTGVLAAVVATPCTGPFMAVALGAALLLPVPQALLLFGGLGLGLALPFLAIAYVPALRAMLPKPGPWLNIFRKAMSVPMGLTALVLLWLLWRLSGDWALLIGISAAVVMVIGSWYFGRAQRRPSGLSIPILVALGIIGFQLFDAALHRLPGPEAGAIATPDSLHSEAFTEDRLAEYRNGGRSVFVYFTADWCVTCKINEAAAINRDITKRAFAGAAINVLKGDFTRRDPAIARFLSQHGRSGVPLYLYYPKGKEAQILPQILTPATLAALK